MELINTSFVSLMTMVEQVYNKFWRDRAGGLLFWMALYGAWRALPTCFSRIMCHQQCPLYPVLVIVKNKERKCFEPSKSLRNHWGGKESGRKGRGEGETARGKEKKAIMVSRTSVVDHGWDGSPGGCVWPLPKSQSVGQFLYLMLNTCSFL